MEKTKDSVSKSWFAVFNNPEEKGYIGDPEEICERLADEWIYDSDSRTCAISYCISANGLKHCHMVLCDSKTMRFSLIKKTYAVGMHFEPTKGSKQQANDYIEKRGKFAEKGESVLYIARRGEIRGAQGKRTDLETAHELIESGQTPKQVLLLHPNLYRYESAVRKMYFDKRDRETPILKNMNVIWHMGDSGSGKSYSRIKLIEEVGEENVYYITTYNNGMFDGYNGQKIIWLEDFKGEIRFGDLLRILDVYKADIHARYSNVKALWEEVHITSISNPQTIYHKMLSESDKQYDVKEQLLRRINTIRYHWKDCYNQYFEMDFSPHITVNEMIEKTVQKSYNPYINTKNTDYEFEEMELPL